LRETVFNLPDKFERGNRQESRLSIMFLFADVLSTRCLSLSKLYQQFACLVVFKVRKRY